MEKINKHNYEIFFLDFIEGILNKSQIKDLEEFLAKNPKLEIEFEDFENVILEPETIKFEQKDKLIKETQAKLFDITNFEYLAITEIENEISEQEKNELNIILDKNPKLYNDFNLYQKTKLKADASIKFPFKGRLKRRVIPIYVKLTSYAIASAIALFLLLNQNSLQNNNSKVKVSQFAQLSNKNIQIKKQTKLSEPAVIQQNEQIQELIISHKQTNNLLNKQILAFDDNEPQKEVNLYENLQVAIPNLKTEALIFTNKNRELESSYTDIAINQNRKDEKDKVWQYAETGVKVWKLISSSEIEMNNKYKEDGSIDKLAIVASNFKFSKTFNR